MSYDIGFNFRDTSGFVTDPANTTYSLGEVYPVTRSMATSGLSVTFGWEVDLTSSTGTNNVRDRNSGIDARLAGLAFANLASSGDHTFQVDLPASGTWQINLAAGDASNAENASWQILDSDGTTVLASKTSTAVGAGEFSDASGVTRTSASDWVTNNASINATFSGTVAYFKLVAVTPPAVFAHIRLYQATSSASSFPPIKSSGMSFAPYLSF